MFDSDLHEECGVAAVWNLHSYNNPDEDLSETSRTLFYALFALQHRGQEAAGIAVSNGKNIHAQKNPGLVSAAFTETDITRLQGHAGVGHTRYSTTGASTKQNIQPFCIETQYGPIALAHNGNLVNAPSLRKKLLQSGVGLSSTSDTEVMVMMLAAAKGSTWTDRIASCMKEWQGAFSIIVLTLDAIYIARDPWGFRPLCAGTIKNEMLVAASESCAMETIGCTDFFEVGPGEIYKIDETGINRSGTIPQAEHTASCIFEFVYFARTDTVWNNASVHVARVQFGKILAQNHGVKADVVIAVPDSARSSAIGFAQGSGIPYNEGLSKNRYIARTFIQPTQKLREQGVAMKFNVLPQVIRGKDIVVVDDSIVRGTTIRHLIEMLRSAGAKKIHVRIACPPLRFPCYMGVDMGGLQKLIAHNRSIEEICTYIGADSLDFLTVDELKAGLYEAGASSEYCTACFTGNYPVDVSQTAEKDSFE
ncbi:MAG: amidophosphoribosyltransferase [Treponemataceae bacterium]